MPSYTCELLHGTTKHSSEIMARFPAEAAELFCRLLVDADEVGLGGERNSAVWKVAVTINGREIRCNVLVRAETKIEYAFEAMEES